MCRPNDGPKNNQVGLSALMWLCRSYYAKLYLSAKASLRPAKLRKSPHKRHIPLPSLTQQSPLKDKITKKNHFKHYFSKQSIKNTFKYTNQ